MASRSSSLPPNERGGSQHHRLTGPEHSTLETKTQFITADKNAKTTTFTGCNVYVQNGLGATNGNPNDPLNNIGGGTTNGLGNLIIGYNYAGRGHTDPNTGQFVSDNMRTGSHNLVMGDMNNYSSYGGLVAGYFNTLSGPLATITGGDDNTASAVFSTVSGGIENTVSATSASVSGGQLNTVSSVAASISGGYNNTASGYAASVSGGQRNSASQNFATVSGGLGVTQSNFYGWSAGSQGGTNVNANFISQ